MKQETSVVARNYSVYSDRGAPLARPFRTTVTMRKSRLHGR